MPSSSISGLVMTLCLPGMAVDVYDCNWVGRLRGAGNNSDPYAVDSPWLDRFDTPQRALVNHSWRASPSLLTARWHFKLPLPFSIC